MLRNLVILVCFVAGVCRGYSFKDPYYNDLILENMLTRKNGQQTALKSDSPEGTDCRRPPKFECCSNLNPENLFQLELTAVECFVEQLLAEGNNETKSSKLSDPLDVFSCTRLKMLQEEYVCLTECVAKKQNILDADQGTLLGTDILVPFVKQYYAEGVYTDEQLGQFVAECTKYTEKVTSECPADFRCKTTAASFGYCMWRKTTLECPLERQIGSASCDDLRVKLATADDRC